MNVKECYELLNGNYAEATSRLMNDRLIERFILKFPQDDSMANLRQALATGNYEDAFRAAHTLKGVAGNLAFSGLHDSASELTETLRADKTAPDAALVNKVEEDYEKILAALAKFQSEK